MTAASRNLVLATLAFAFCFSAWGMIAPLAPDLQDELKLSDTETSIMVAVPVVLGSLLRLPLGWLTDKLGGRILFTVMLAYSAAAAVLVGFASSYAMLLVAGFVLGAAGATFAVGVPFVSQWHDQARTGFALGVYGMGNIGTAVAAFSVPAIRDAASQEVAGFVFGAAVAAYALIWLALARNAPVEVAPPRYREVLRAGADLWRLSLFYFVTFGGFVAMAVFLPKLLRDWFDLSLTDAGLRAAGFTLVATAVRPIGGWLSDRYGGHRILSVAFIGVGIDAIGLAWQASGPEIAPVTVFCLSLAGFLGLGSGAVFKLVPQFFPDSTGAATGIVGAAGGLGGFFPPLVLGLVKDATGTFAMAFVFLVAFAWLCAGMAFGLRPGERAPDPAAP